MGKVQPFEHRWCVQAYKYQAMLWLLLSGTIEVSGLPSEAAPMERVLQYSDLEEVRVTGARSSVSRRECSW